MFSYKSNADYSAVTVLSSEPVLLSSEPVLLVVDVVLSRIQNTYELDKHLGTILLKHLRKSLS